MYIIYNIRAAHRIRRLFLHDAQHESYTTITQYIIILNCMNVPILLLF